jgi:hypothetical protein
MMGYRSILLFTLLLLPSTVFSNDQAWIYVVATSIEKGWSVSQQGKADVSISGELLLIKLYNPQNPSAISDTIKGKIKGTKITDALATSHRTLDGDFTEYRFPYAGSMEKIGYQASVGGPDPGGRETIMLTSSVGFLGLTREIKEK